MSLDRFAREIARLEPAIRRDFEDVHFAPSDPWAAMLEAIAERSVRPRHFAAVWQAENEWLRASLLSEARVHRSRRLAGMEPPQYASVDTRATSVGRALGMSAAAAAATILSYLPEESPPKEISDVLLAEGVYPFEILAEVPVSDPYFPQLVRGSIVMRIIGTRDAMELREEIWDSAESRRSPP